MCFDYDIGCEIMRKTRKNPVKKLRISFLFIHCEKRRSIRVWGEQDLTPSHITVPLTEPNLNMTAYLWYLRPYSKHYFSPLFSALGHPILPNLFKFMNLEVLNKANYSSSCRTGTYFFLPWKSKQKITAWVKFAKFLSSRLKSKTRPASSNSFDFLTLRFKEF